MTVFLAWYFWQEKDSDLTLRLSLALILAGAIGNLIDRMLFGTVVDFFDFMIGSYHWYIFNVADASVTIGMILYICNAVLKQSAVKPSTESI
jgi:signal peptidase II